MRFLRSISTALLLGFASIWVVAVTPSQAEAYYYHWNGAYNYPHYWNSGYGYSYRPYSNYYGNYGGYGGYGSYYNNYPYYNTSRNPWGWYW